MLGAIWAADLLQRLIKREHALHTGLMNLLSGIGLVVFVMWLLGYFMLGPSPVAPGGYGRMNLLALFDSRGDWSRLIPGIPLYDFWDGDGFAYPGAGILFLLVLALVLLFRKGNFRATPQVITPLVLMSVCLVFISVTNYVTFGPYLVLQFELPDWAIRLYQVFRSPGRLFWPVYYLLSAVAVGFICLRIKTSLAASVLILALAIQLYDLSKMAPRIHSYFTQDGSWESSLVSPMWRELGVTYRKVLYVPPGNDSFDFIPLADFANRHRMSVNIGNFARYDLGKFKSHQEKLSLSINSGDFDPQAIYVFKDFDYWLQAQSNMGDYDQAGILDGFKLLLPGLKSCSTCQLEGFAESTTDLVTLPASHLLSIVGELKDGRLIARQAIPGYLSYGPYIKFPAGHFEYVIVYSSAASSSVEVGSWDVVSNAVDTTETLAAGRLMGTAGEERAVQGILNLAQAKEKGEIRTFSKGEHDLQLIRVEIKPSIEQYGEH